MESLTSLKTFQESEYQESEETLRSFKGFNIKHKNLRRIYETEEWTDLVVFQRSWSTTSTTLLQRVSRLVKYKPGIQVVPTNDEFEDKVASKLTKALLDNIGRMSTSKQISLMNQLLLVQ